MTYQWRTYDHSRVHHVSAEGHGQRPLCEMALGKMGTTSIKEPGCAQKCLQCAREVIRVCDAAQALNRFSEVG